MPEFRDTLTGEQQLTLALLVVEFEEVTPDDRDEVTEEERVEKAVIGLTPIARYVLDEGISPDDFHPLHVREGVLYPALLMARAVQRPDAFYLPGGSGGEVAHAVLKAVGLIGG